MGVLSALTSICNELKARTMCGLYYTHRLLTYYIYIVWLPSFVHKEKSMMATELMSFKLHLNVAGTADPKDLASLADLSEVGWIPFGHGVYVPNMHPEKPGSVLFILKNRTDAK